MAAIGSIRKHSTLLLIIVALALLAFLLGDLSGNNRGNKVYDKFITIGKQNISYNHFLDKHTVIRNLYRGQQLTPDQEFSLNVQAYDELVDSVIIGNQANYLGITITADELRDWIAGPNPHQITRQFFSSPQGGYDMQIAQQFLDNLEMQDTNYINYYLSYIEPTIEKDAFISKYFNLLTGAYHLPKAFAEKMANESMLKATIELVQLPYSSPLASDDKISFTEEDLKKCYEKNKYRFKQDEELRSVEYVMFNIEPTEEDLNNIAQEVNTLFEEFKGTDRPDYFVNRLVDSRYDSTFHKQGELGQGIDTLLFNAPEGTFAEPFIEGEYWTFAKLLASQTRPDSVNISLIGVAHNGTDQNNPRKKEEADKIADSAFMMARRGMDFYEVTKQYSDINVEQQPDQGRIWLEDGKMDQLSQLFFDSLNMLPVGSIKKMDLPKYGATYIFRVNEKTSEQRKIRVAIARKQILPSKETINNIENRANNFVNGTDDYQKFKEAAAKYNVDPRINDRVQKMDYSLPGVPSGGREIVRWVYGEDTKKGMVSQVFSLEDMYLVAVVKDIYAKGYRTLEQEQVRNQIESMVKRDKKAELLENALKQSLTSGLTTIAANNNVVVDTITVSFADRNFGRYGPEGKVIGKLFGTKEGSTEILKGDMGVYAVKINGFDVPSMEVSQSLQSNVEMIIMQNRMMNQNRFQNGTRSMRKIYEIKDNMILVM